MKESNYIRICLYCKVKTVALYLLAGITLSMSSLINADSMSVATQNAYNFYNDENNGKREKVLSRKNYQLRLNRMSKHIAMVLNKPDIVALQEIENFDTLNDLANTLKTEFNVCYQSVLLNGHKRVAINVAYLINCEYEIKNLSQLFKNKRLKNSRKKLYTRPPLYINVCKDSHCYHLVNVHLRSMIGLNKKRKRAFVAKKRHQQAEELAIWIDRFQSQWPDEKLIILGDFNALKISDRYVDVLGIIKGTPSKEAKEYPSSDLIKRNLYDLSLQIPQQNRFSYRYKKKQQSLDYVLVSQNLVPFIKNVHYTDINYKVSDHAGLLAQFEAK